MIRWWRRRKAPVSDPYEDFWRLGLCRLDPVEIWEWVPDRIKIDLVCFGVVAFDGDGRPYRTAP